MDDLAEWRWTIDYDDMGNMLLWLRDMSRGTRCRYVISYDTRRSVSNETWNSVLSEVKDRMRQQIRTGR